MKFPVDIDVTLFEALQSECCNLTPPSWMTSLQDWGGLTKPQTRAINVAPGQKLHEVKMTSQVLASRGRLSCSINSHSEDCLYLHLHFSRGLTGKKLGHPQSRSIQSLADPVLLLSRFLPPYSKTLPWYCSGSLYVSIVVPKTKGFRLEFKECLFLCLIVQRLIAKKNSYCSCCFLGRLLTGVSPWSRSGLFKKSHTFSRGCIIVRLFKGTPHRSSLRASLWMPFLIQSD